MDAIKINTGAGQQMEFGCCSVTGRREERVKAAPAPRGAPRPTSFWALAAGSCQLHHQPSEGQPRMEVWNSWISFNPTTKNCRLTLCCAVLQVQGRSNLP